MLRRKLPLIALIYLVAVLFALWGYATAARGLTQGRANYTMEPLAYRIMPQALARDILEVSY